MKTFFINTATRETCIAVYVRDEVLAKKSWPAQQNEAEKLQPQVDTLLRECELEVADIDRLVVCIGPGGFTSTRVGVSATNAWSFAAQIPMASVSIFELYPPKEILIVAANPKEGWVKMPEKDPVWTSLDNLSLPDTFSFAGILNDEWISALKMLGGSYLKESENLPQINQLQFTSETAKPWYYKDPNITWSEKNRAPENC